MPPSEGSPRTRIAAFVSEFGIAAALGLEILLFALLSPYFFTADNILNVTLQTSITAIIAAGMTFVILTGGIDLSVGALVAFTGVVTTSCLKSGLPEGILFPAAALAGIGAGAVSGLLAGLFVTKFRITPFIVTLALMTVWRGAAYMYTDGRPVWGLPEGFGILGSGRLLGVPVPT